MTREERDLLVNLADSLVRVIRLLMDVDRKVNGLIRGHNALVRLVVREGEEMSAVSDAILAEDAKTVVLVQAIQDLVNKLNNGNNTLDAETRAALSQLDEHLNTVTQEVADAGQSPATGGSGDTPGGSPVL